MRLRDTMRRRPRWALLALLLGLVPTGALHAEVGDVRTDLSLQGSRYYQFFVGEIVRGVVSSLDSDGFVLEVEEILDWPGIVPQSVQVRLRPPQAESNHRSAAEHHLQVGDRVVACLVLPPISVEAVDGTPCSEMESGWYSVWPTRERMRRKAQLGADDSWAYFLAIRRFTRAETFQERIELLGQFLRSETRGEKQACKALWSETLGGLVVRLEGLNAEYVRQSAWHPRWIGCKHELPERSEVWYGHLHHMRSMAHYELTRALLPDLAAAINAERGKSIDGTDEMVSMISMFMMYRSTVAELLLADYLSLLPERPGFDEDHVVRYHWLIRRAEWHLPQRELPALRYPDRVPPRRPVPRLPPSSSVQPDTWHLNLDGLRTWREERHRTMMEERREQLEEELKSEDVSLRAAARGEWIVLYGEEPEGFSW